MQQFYIHEILEYKSNESTAVSAYFHKLTTAKTTCTHNVFGNEENFRKKSPHYRQYMYDFIQ